MKNRQSLIYSLLGMLFIGTVIFSVVSYNNTRSFVLESVERETDDLLNNFTIEVNRFLRERLTNIELIADHIPYLLESDEDIAHFLSMQRDSIPYFAGLGFFTPGGEVQAADGQCFPIEEKASFKRALLGEIVFSDVFKLDQDDSQNITAIFVPVVSKEGETVGVVAGVVNVCNLVSELVKESNLPGTVFLLKDGEVLFTSGNGSSFKETIPESEHLLEMITQEQMGSWNDPQDDLRFVKYQTAQDDWVVVVDSGSNEATNKIPQRFWLNLLLVVSVLIINIAITIYLLHLQKREKLQKEQDMLTGLGNRAYLEENITREMAKNPNLIATIYFIKLDYFLAFTERMGYSLSDEVLFVLSRRLKAVERKIDVYRVGDEEFVVMAYFKTVAEQLEFAAELVEKIERPIHVEQGKPLALTASVGVRTALMTEDVNHIMQDVVFASREAIKRGGNQYVYFTGEIAKESEQQRQLIDNLGQALGREEFYLVYQPIYSVADNQIVSFEALMRWNSPVLGEIGPGQFIPLLEANEEIVEAGRWVIQEVAEQVLRWEREGYDDFTIALNVSAKQVQYEHFLQEVEQILSATGVDPSRLVFEVTESVVVQDVGWAHRTLKSLNDMGIQTAIDDFGTGYSSLAILKALPFHYMKLDRAFVMEVMSDDGISEAILRGLVEIAKSLDLMTIAEGVETREQLDVLERIGAHSIQGYYFSKPIVAEEAVKFLDHEAFQSRFAD